MAAGDAVQLGTAYEIGIGSLSYSGYEAVDGDFSYAKDTEEHKDARGAVVSVISRNPRSEFKATFNILNGTDATTLVPPAPNTVITLTPPQGTSTKWRVRSASVKTSVNISQLSLDLVREDSMATTYDA